MAVAETATVVAPANWMKGIAENSPPATQDHTGVCRRVFTLASGFDTGSWSSRAIPKARRMVEVMIAIQQTKMAADRTNRERGAKALSAPKASLMPVLGKV